MTALSGAHYLRLMRGLLICFIFLSMVFSIPLSAQKLITWETLGDVKFQKSFSAELGIDLLTATFGPSVKALDQQEVIIKGFMIPLDPLGTQYVLSRFPMANCFFCGGAGPETVVELRLHPNSIRRYKMDEVHMFKGTLLLNADNAESLNYIISGAERM